MKRLTLLLILGASVIASQMNAQEKKTGNAGDPGTATANDVVNPAKINGKVLDQFHNPVRNAVVELLKAKDSTLVKAVLTNTAGEYEFANVPAGKVFVMACVPGFENVIGNMTGTTNENAMQMENLLVSKSGNENAQPLLVQMDGKVVMDIEGNGVKVSGTAFDILKMAPNVVENEQGNLVFNGHSSIVVKIDGRSTDLDPQGLRNMLRSMKAEDVSGVELVTVSTNRNNDGPYINLITLKGAHEGLYGELTSGVGYGKTPKAEAGLALTFVKGPFTLTGEYASSNNRTKEHSMVGQSFVYENMPVNFMQESNSYENPISNAAAFTLEYDGAKGFSFGGKISGSKDHSFGTQTDVTTMEFPTYDTALVSSRDYTTTSTDNTTIASFHVGQTIRKTHSNVTAEFRTGQEILKYDQMFPLEGMTGGTHGEILPTQYRFAGSNTMHVSSAELSYTQRWTNRLITIMGVKKSLLDNASTLVADQFVSNEWIDAGVTHKFFNYKQETRSLYMISYVDLGKLQVTAMLEGQQVTASGLSQSAEIAEHKSGINLFPTVILDQTINKNNSIKATFSQKIQRPSFSDLNPSGHYTNQFTYVVGNPMLKPEVSNNADLTYTLFSLFTVTGGLEMTLNGIERVSSVDNATGTIIETKMNLSKSRNASIGAALPLPIGKHLIFSNEVKWTFSNFQSDFYGTAINNNSRSFTGTSVIALSLPSDIKVNIVGFYLSPTTNGFVSTSSMGFVNASISKQLLNKHLEVELSVNDIFKTGNVNATILTQDGTITYRSVSETQTFNIKAKYAFGNRKVKADQE